MTRSRRFRQLAAWVAGVAVVLSAAAGILAIVAEQAQGGAIAAPASSQPLQVSTPATASPLPPPRPPAIDTGTLPEARYDAVIAGLLSADGQDPTGSKVYSTAEDLAVYDAPGGSPVARLAATDFLGEPTPVVVVATTGGWGLVLTPARRTLPSQAGTGGVPAASQSAAWAWIGDLPLTATPTEHIVVSTSDQTVSIVAEDGSVLQAFPAGVGSADTPSPVGTTGYLEQRYVDPAQGTGDVPIHLTSLHSTVADEPYGGSDGGLIGIHYSDDRSGAISHGCIRIGDDAVAALEALPLGTLVTFV